MRKIYRKGPPPAQRIKKVIWNFYCRNEEEQRSITRFTVERHMRQQLIKDRPELSPAEVERLIVKRMERGLRPYRSLKDTLL